MGVLVDYRAYEFLILTDEKPQLDTSPATEKTLWTILWGGRREK
jgi:hypothetical protein